MYLTAIIGRRDKRKKKNKANQEKNPQEVRNDQKNNNANPENDPQEVQIDEATDKYKFQHKTWKTRWHQTLQKLPPGQIIDIPYLKTLGKNKSVPIAYCPKVVNDPHACPIVDIEQVTNFVPGYLASADGRLWEVFDVQNFSVKKFNWDEGKHTILDLFGTSIQHPEDHFVEYFCGTIPTLIEGGSPPRSPRKNPPETHNTVGRGLSSLVSPGRGGADLPGQVGAQEDND